MHPINNILSINERYNSKLTAWIGTYQSVADSPSELRTRKECDLNERENKATNPSVEEREESTK